MSACNDQSLQAFVEGHFAKVAGNCFSFSLTVSVLHNTVRHPSVNSSLDNIAADPDMAGT